MKINEVKETKYGVYVWEMPNGAFVADEDKNWLSINSDEGNIKRICEIQETVKSFGIFEGKATFLRGMRKCDDEEYARQQARMALGLIPDEYDVPAYREIV